ncbi:MAG: 16S rRNA (guanine(966)-N(2))-methyltransferase RsmD [Bdellovibrionales bacterium]
MRVIAGALKGLKLVSWKSSERFSIRPMTDRVKETVFNVLQAYFNKDVLFLDLFSGTGSLSMEALSRGAKEAHAVEMSKHSIKIIKENQKKLKNPRQLMVHKSDVFDFLKKSRLGPFHIIIADPPFPLECGEKILETLVSSHLYIVGTIFVLETSDKENLKDRYSCFYLFSKKDFNDKKIWFYEARK